jgi:hypothetical protein
MLDFLKRSFGLKRPIYNELSVYLVALTCILMLLTNADFRQTLFSLAVLAVSDVRPLLGVVVISLLLFLELLLGLFLSIFHVLTARPESPFEKSIMTWFAVFVTAIASMTAGGEAIHSTPSFLLVVPVWNILMGLVLMIQIRAIRFSNQNASRQEVLIASGVLIVIYSVAYFVFRLSWAMTFSICIFFSSSILFILSWAINRLNPRPPDIGSSGLRR